MSIVGCQPNIAALVGARDLSCLIATRLDIAQDYLTSGAREQGNDAAFGLVENLIDSPAP